MGWGACVFTIDSGDPAGGCDGHPGVFVACGVRVRVSTQDRGGGGQASCRAPALWKHNTGLEHFSRQSRPTTPHTKVAWLHVGLGTHPGASGASGFSTPRLGSPRAFLLGTLGNAGQGHLLKNSPGPGTVVTFVNRSLKGISCHVSKTLFLPDSFSFC